MIFLKKRILDDMDMINHRDKKPYSWIKDLAVMIGIIVLATLISFLFRAIGFYESNYIMIYILGVLLISNFTEKYLFGVIASIISVLIFNYFFTEPYYTFLTYSPEYPLTFLVMIVVSLLTSTLSGRVKQESKIAEMREKRIRILYQIEKDLLSANDIIQVIQITSEDISELFGTSVFVAAADIQGDLSLRHIEGENLYNDKNEKAACSEAYQSNTPCGAGTALFPLSRAYFHPISGQSGVLGIIGIASQSGFTISNGQRAFLETISAQIALVLERERLYEKQKQNQFEIERERLRADLLRAISHDLRTPLTSILGSSSMLIENFYEIKDDTKLSFLHEIYADSEWLSNLIENILQMTKFDEAKINLKKEMEVIEEIIADALSRIEKIKGNHVINVNLPIEMIMINVDGTLIEQVLINLLNNAIKYTQHDSIIEINVIKKNDVIEFEVSDNGSGISEKDIPFIFSRFFTSENKTQNNRRGIGIGLAISKSIIEAHGGDISVENKPSGGAMFRFTLPYKENSNEAVDFNS